MKETVVYLFYSFIKVLRFNHSSSIKMSVRIVGISNTSDIPIVTTAKNMFAGITGNNILRNAPRPYLLQKFEKDIFPIKL